MKGEQQIAAVVVTFNRIELLKSCVKALRGQSRTLNQLVVVDNASTDGTGDWLRSWLPANVPYGSACFLASNTGGAGGFAEGMRTAIEHGADWIWVMDDDALPSKVALEKLLTVVTNTADIYGSLAVQGEDTSWLTILTDENSRAVRKIAEVPVKARVQSLPFLGFMIHRSLVEKIGLPDADFFIAADDIEYCMRAQAAGADIFIAGQSRIEHPKADTYVARLPFRNLICLRLAPWKRYYDTRNRILIARKYYGIRMVTQTIPGSCVRLIAALLHEPNKLAQTWAFIAGMTDGILGRKGRRHTNWGINA